MPAVVALTFAVLLAIVQGAGRDAAGPGPATGPSPSVSKPPRAHRPRADVDALDLRLGVPDRARDHRGRPREDRAARPVWRHPMAPRDTGDFGFAGSPAVGGGLVDFGGLDGRVYAFRQ